MYVDLYLISWRFTIQVYCNVNAIFFFFSECYEMYYFYCRIFCSFYVKMHKEINIFLWIFKPVALITQSAPSRTQPI